MGGHGWRCGPPASAPATVHAPVRGGDHSCGRGEAASPDASAARAAAAGVPRAKPCGGPEQDTATARSTPQNGAAGSTAGTEGASIAAAPEAVAAAGAAAESSPTGLRHRKQDRPRFQNRLRPSLG